MQAGEFAATLSVADDGIAQALLWHLGSITVAHASAAAPALSAAQALKTPKPEIHHIFQAPGKRPPAAVSLAFTVLSVAPLAILLIHLSKLGVNIKVSISCSFLHLLVVCRRHARFWLETVQHQQMSFCRFYLAFSVVLSSAIIANPLPRPNLEHALKLRSCLWLRVCAGLHM